MAITRAWDGNRLLRGALVASLGLHLLLALVLPKWMPAQSGGPQPVEALTFARVIRVQTERLAPASRPTAVPDTTKRAAKVSFARRRHELTANTHKPLVRPTAVNGPLGTVASAPHHIAAHRPAPLLAQAPATSVPVATTQSASQRTPQPEATISSHAMEGAGVADRGGVLPLGAAQDPVLDPSALQLLQKRVSVHVTLKVTVGEDGHLKHVDFQPPIDAQLERQIEQILADANWDAAVCGGGVSCEGVATIKL